MRAALIPAFTALARPRDFHSAAIIDIAATFIAMIIRGGLREGVFSRLHHAIETCVADMTDPTRKARLALLKADWDSAKAAIKRAYAELPPDTVPPRLPAAKIDQIEVDDGEIRITVAGANWSAL